LQIVQFSKVLFLNTASYSEPNMYLRQ
jgi:hypothetical protein